MLFKHKKPLEWVDVRCPVCKIRIGQKKKTELGSFECPDCKATHYFYPGEFKRPSKSVPKSHNKSSGCGCGHCGR